jgi:hypothetical protein
MVLRDSEQGSEKTWRALKRETTVLPCGISRNQFRESGECTLDKEDNSGMSLMLRIGAAKVAN